MKPSDILRHAKIYLETDPSRWTQRTYGDWQLTENHIPKGPVCATGAIAYVTQIPPGQIEREVNIPGGQAIRFLKLVTGYDMVNEFNDKHSYAEVIDAFSRAIELAEFIEDNYDRKVVYG